MVYVPMKTTGYVLKDLTHKASVIHLSPSKHSKEVVKFVLKAGPSLYLLGPESEENEDGWAHYSADDSGSDPDSDSGGPVSNIWNGSKV